MIRSVVLVLVSVVSMSAADKEQMFVGQHFLVVTKIAVEICDASDDRPSFFSPKLPTLLVNVESGRFSFGALLHLRLRLRS